MTGGTRNAICLCVDARMMIPAMFVAHSVLAHSPRDGAHDLFIFCEPGQATAAQRDWMAERGIVLRDDMDVARYHHLFDADNRISAATLIRLFLPETLRETHDRILYLDADLTIHDDVARIFSLDLGGHAFAAARAGVTFETEEAKRQAERHFAELGMTKPFRYFNSGVLLIDTQAWLAARISERALDFYRDHAAICALPDEDSLNAVMDGDFCGLSPVWNMNPSKTPAGMAARFSPVIVHHFGAGKPWRLFSRSRRYHVSRHYHRLYRAFLKGTPWQGWLAEQGTPRDALRCLEGTAADLVRSVTRRRQRAAFAAARSRYLAEESFADVAQGIVVRGADGALRLAKR